MGDLMKATAAIYARVSSEAQVKGSGLDVQIAECQRYAAEMGFEVFDVYKDEGISGAHRLHHRAGLEKMKGDAERGCFKVLLVHELDRLARDITVGVHILGIVGELDVRLVEVATRSSFEDVGALTGLVKLWAAGEDRKRILQRTKKGQIERAKRGLVSGPAPLGYDRDKDGRLVINDEEATLVRRLYHLYLEEGYNFDSLADLMNKEGIKTKRARANEAGQNKYRGVHRWQRSTIQCLIRNPVYKGEYVYGKTRGRTPADKEYKPSKKRPMQKAYLETAIKNRNFIPHEQVIVPVPAIIDAGTWERAQSLKQERYRRTNLTLGASVYRYNFTSIVRCLDCGRVMTRTTIAQETKTKGTKYHPYYVCRNRENGCPNWSKHHRLDLIDAAIMARVLPLLQNPELVRESLSATMSDQQHERDKLVSQRLTIERNIANLHLEVQRLRDGFAAGACSADELMADRKPRDEAIATLKRELEDLNVRIEQIGVDDLEEKLEMVVACLSQPAFQLHEPGMTLSTLFPNRVEKASRNYKTSKMTVKEYLETAPGTPSLEDDDLEVAKQFLKVVQMLVKRVTVNTESQIIDFVLWIQPPPPENPDGGEAENYKANLNSITSPSATTYSLPSIRTRPFSLAADLEPEATRSS